MKPEAATERGGGGDQYVYIGHALQHGRQGGGGKGKGAAASSMAARAFAVCRRSFERSHGRNSHISSHGTARMCGSPKSTRYACTGAPSATPEVVCCKANAKQERAYTETHLRPHTQPPATRIRAQSGPASAICQRCASQFGACLRWPRAEKGIQTCNRCVGESATASAIHQRTPVTSCPASVSITFEPFAISHNYDWH